MRKETIDQRSSGNVGSLFDLSITLGTRRVAELVSTRNFSTDIIHV